MSELTLEVVTPDRTVVSTPVAVAVCPGMAGEWNLRNWRKTLTPQEPKPPKDAPKSAWQTSPTTSTMLGHRLHSTVPWFA